MGELTRQFLFAFEDDPPRPRFNVAPMQAALVVREGANGRYGAMLRWGLIPSWAKDPKIASSTINARSETLAEKPAFRTAFQRRRCLVLVDGYYEWRVEGKAKLPLLYQMDGGKPFALAGLWESWRGGPNAPGREDDKPIETFSIVTVPANRLASAVHDRMPAILGENDWAPWLDPKQTDAAKAAGLLATWPDEHGLSVTPANPRVNKVQNDDAECLVPPGV